MLLLRALFALKPLNRHLGKLGPLAEVTSIKNVAHILQAMTCDAGDLLGRRVLERQTRNSLATQVVEVEALDPCLGLPNDVRNPMVCRSDRV